MKKTLSFLLALGLLLILCLSASADSLISSEHYNWLGADLNEKTGTIVVKNKNGCVYLADANGKMLSAEYKALTEKGEVFLAFDGIHYGIIDGRSGKELVPCRYDYADTLGGKNVWFVGCRLANAGDSVDYDTSFYNLSTRAREYRVFSSADLYYGGKKVGTLPREKFSSKAHVYVYGAYLFIKMPGESEYTVYDAEFNTSTSKYAREYSEKGMVITHCGSGQLAFDPSCTLSSGEVEQSIYAVSDFYYDLQGNRLFISSVPYTSSRIVDDRYALVSLDHSKYGVIDMHGKEIIPPECDLIDYFSGLFRGGYQAVKKDGKIGFYDLNGNLTCPFEYSYNAAKIKGPFAEINDPKGGKIVLSGAVGELPRRYADVNIPFGGSATCFAAEDECGLVGVVDIRGNVIIPFGAAFQSCHDLELSEDGSVILGRVSYGHYVIYRLRADAVPHTSDVTEEFLWVCPVCGRIGNNGRFCPDCGSAKPSSAAGTKAVEAGEPAVEAEAVEVIEPAVEAEDVEVIESAVEAEAVEVIESAVEAEAVADAPQIPAESDGIKVPRRQLRFSSYSYSSPEARSLPAFRRVIRIVRRLR